MQHCEYCPKDSGGRVQTPPAEMIVPKIAGEWVAWVRRVGDRVETSGKDLAAAPAADCVLSFGRRVFEGSPRSGLHAEMDCLARARMLGMPLELGRFADATGACCLMCATALAAVGIRRLPAVDGDPLACAAWHAPGFLFDDPALCSGLLGDRGAHLWLRHVPTAIRRRQRGPLTTSTTLLLAGRWE
jgi:tRNA(Arg) A34 adenosine deaminase TadA